ncbi:MAG: DUF4355 domain-containing protein [Chloroflexota bacterium]
MYRNFIRFNANTTGGEGGQPPATPPATPPTTPPSTPPAGDNAVPTTWEDVFKHKRFKDLNDRAKTAETQLAQIQADQQAANEAALAEQNQWKQLAEQREQQLNAERRERLRLQVATDKGLPASLAARLQGDTVEALSADADQLLELVKPATSPGVPPPSGGATPPTVDLSQMTPAQIRAATRGQG